ncbi:MAG: hypothetical protein N2200_02025 [Bacteroidia bacterium]|nr:hypothetical protein [Bacteroidia bacterium]
MQKETFTKTLLPIAIIALFSVLYFLPLYQGYRFRASDQTQLEYMNYPLTKLYQETGKLAFWAPHLFGGMPAYLIYHVPEGIYFLAPMNIAGQLFREYGPSAFFVGGLGFFILLRLIGIRWAWALGGALGFILTSYYSNMIIATHWGKSNVIFSVPYVLSGMMLLRRNSWAWGIILSLLGWAGMAGGNHPQMMYYALSVIGGVGVLWLWETWQTRSWWAFGKGVAIFALCAGIGAASQISSLLPFYEYGRYSIRGGSELERDTEKDPSLRSGLDKEYAQNYSASRAEIWTMIIPDFVGGTSQEDLWGRLGRSSALAEALQSHGIGDINILRSAPTYWGGSPFSAGSFYISAIALFLMILGWTYGMQPIDWILAYVGWIVIQLSLGLYGYALWATAVLLLLPVAAHYAARFPKKLWMKASAATMTFLIGWGLISLIDDSPETTYKLTDWALDYLPFYNKFRAPSTWLVIMGILLPWLGMRGIQRFLEAPQRENLFSALSVSVGILLLIGIGGALGFSFEGAYDASLKTQAQLPDWFMEALREDRISLAQRSAMRSILWVMLAGGVLLLLSLRQISESLAGGVVAALIALDGWLLNSSYFPKRETYVKSREIQIPPPLAPHETILRADTSAYRILPLHTNPFTDARPGVYFENAGGYHPAKLKRYQQFIEAHLSRLEPEALKMMSVKYITARPGTPVPPTYDSLTKASDDVVIFRAKDTLPMAWLVETVRVFPRVDQTLDSIGKYPVHQVAIVAEKDWQRITPQPSSNRLDSAETVVCVKRNAYELEYKVRTRQPRLLVMSEVYYPKDWSAAVNSQTVPIIPVNFILRGVVVPAGESTVRLTCESAIHNQGRRISLIGSVLAWGMIAVSMGWMVVKRRKVIPT